MEDNESKKRLSEALEDLLLEEDIQRVEMKEEESDFEIEVDDEKINKYSVFVNCSPETSKSEASKNGVNKKETSEILWKPGPSKEAECNQILFKEIKSRLSPNNVINLKSDAFHQFFSDEILELIVHYTNQRGVYMKEHDPNFQWEALDKIELTAFLGLLIFYGVMNGRGKPFSEFWSQEYGFPIFTATMTCKRMQDIIHCLRFDDMNSRVSRRVNSGDNLEAVREFVNLFSLKCRTNFNCFTDVIIGRRICCQGLKSYDFSNRHSLIEIFYAVDIYNNYITNIEIPKGEETREDMILNLTQHLNDSGKNIITPPGYTNYYLSQKLKERNLRLTGSLPKNHEDLPNEFFTSELNPISCHLEDTTLFFNPSPGTESKVILSTMKFEEIEDAVAFYNDKIDNIHKFEKMIEKYTVKRNSRRWPLDVFYNVVDIAALNAHSIYKYLDPSSERRKFLLELAKELTEEHISRRLTSANEKICRAVSIMGLKHLLSRKSETKNILEARNMKQTLGKKRGRCFSCPRSLDRKCSEKCEECSTFVCYEHRGVLCTRCFRKNKNLSDNDD